MVARFGDNLRHDSWQDPMFLSLLLAKILSVCDNFFRPARQIAAFWGVAFSV